ncbi:unnamed protein product [Nippostrongylus brasiliensis]|uniref:Transmembrane protein n=1 Tax=Nippostrongylus brasiliensis TaxID=27835 RepID=A0A0N4YCD0_NIPBR|nr:unnamed protein product [Nippostrongylus brasiliensis]
MRADFEMGRVLRANIIPFAVVFFIGEAEHGDDEDEKARSRIFTHIYLYLHLYSAAICFC